MRAMRHQRKYTGWIEKTEGAGIFCREYCHEMSEALNRWLNPPVKNIVRCFFIGKNRNRKFWFYHRSE